MNLWTEYEGRTIDGSYPLTRLLRSEGRSAFFSTSNGTGAPTVIRLIESHFDGDEILTRWRGVEALHHPNLVKLKSFGHVVIDETSLVYAVMEPVDANLDEILSERRLTEQETREIATSLLAGIEALHSSGFVHEHVQPENVLAVGEVIKLRSDCIRETLEGDEGAALKRKDVHDYATVLLQALTQQRTLEDAKRDLPLPAPFEQIVRKGMSGEWGFAEIDAALNTTVARSVPAAVAAEAPVVRPVAAPVIPQPPPLVATRIHVSPGDKGGGINLRLVAYGVGALLILLLGGYFYFGYSRPAESDGSSGAVQEPAAPATVAQPSAPATPKSSAATVAGAASSPSLAHGTGNAPAQADQDASGDSSGRWRVIAFTYNQEELARQKVVEISLKHPDLKPSVFTLTGQAPFLVTLGGSMSKQDAFALSGKAKREGLPQDTYAQNYRYR
ncbi:MAG: protein kinase [Edaphobacter sp.]